MPADPVVSVVIPCRNAADDISCQLDALCAQTGAPEFEVIVADNGSDDDLVGACAPYADRLDLRVIAASDRRGVCHARNRGVLAARGRIVMLCDADDAVSETFVAELADAVGTGGRLAAGWLDYDRFNSPDVQAGLALEPGWWTRPFLGYLPFAYGCALAITRADYLALGGMDESIVGGADDVDFSWRAQEAGIRVVNVPGAVVHYRLRADPAGVWRQHLGYKRCDALVWARTARRRPGFTIPTIPACVRELAAVGIRSIGWALLPPGRRLALAKRAGSAAGFLTGRLRYLRPPKPIYVGPAPERA